MFYGLGSNDVGGFFVSLIVIFLYFYEWEGLFFNFILAVMVEEEILGVNGIVVVFLELLEIVVGIIGEFMQMQLAIVECGLMVIDVEVIGIVGYVVRNEGVNVIYLVLKDIEWICQYDFEWVSCLLGLVKVIVM